jgi:hypothetical protein
MGARANAVIIEHGQREIYYHQWAAIDIPSMLMAGQKGICEAIRQSEYFQPRDALTDTVWAEGGLVVNCDTGHVTYWGGELYHDPYVRRYIVPAWKEIWPGWDFTWAIFGQPDIARAADIDPSTVIVTEYDSPEFLFADDPLLIPEQISALSTGEEQFYRYLLSLRLSTSAGGDYELAVPDDMSNAIHDASPLDLALTVGPSLIDRVMTLAPVTLETENRYRGGVAVDVVQRRMVYWDRFAIDERKLTAFERRWHGWRVQAAEDGPREHMALLGRNPSTFFIPKQICLQEMISALVKYVSYAKRDAYFALLTRIFSGEFTD